MPLKIEFEDEEVRFGEYTFLEILEERGIPHKYDGHFLEIESRASEVVARQLWQSLTGSGVFGRLISPRAYGITNL